MVFLADWQDKDRDHRIVYGLFGIQAAGRFDTAKIHQLSTLYQLLLDSADHIDHLRDEDHNTGNNNGIRSATFVAYWQDTKTYNDFISSSPFQDFWAALPDDAGVWREVMTIPIWRTMFAASQNLKWGLASLVDKLRASNDEGYWGVYRHRIGVADDAFTSPYRCGPPASVEKPAKAGEAQTITIPERCSTNEPLPVRQGRVRLSDLPDNICFVREGQRQPRVAKEELKLWLEMIEPHARSWIEHLDDQRNKNGVVSFTTHIGHTTPNLVVDAHDSFAIDQAQPVAETDQLAYFLDLAHFEKAGRSHKGHVHLRKTVMQVYGPGGQMDKIGKAELYVELVILKSGELDAEYIGCVEGTGLMHMEKLCRASD